MKRLLLIICVLFPVCACGEEGPCGGTYLAGTFDNEEVRALSRVVEAFEAVGEKEPCCIVTYVHSPDTIFRDTTWSEYRLSSGLEPTCPGEGYKGLADTHNGVAYVRRYGCAEPHLVPLLVHELLHMNGWNHGQRMSERQQEILEWLSSSVD